jgi:hypothetical protein
MRANMYDFGCAQGFEKYSSYHTARVAKKDLVEMILSKIK